MTHAPCPICGDPYPGFHFDDCGSRVAVPRECVIVKVEPERVKLTPEEIAERRAAAAARREAAMT